MSTTKFGTKASQVISGGSTSGHLHPAEIRSRIYSNLGRKLPSLDDMRQEIDAYTDVFMARMPLAKGLEESMGLLEFATAVAARYDEMELLIQRGENDMLPQYTRGGMVARFRTGELRAAQDMAKRMAELGSRRLTMALAQAQMRV